MGLFNQLFFQADLCYLVSHLILVLVFNEGFWCKFKAG